MMTLKELKEKVAVAENTNALPRAAFLKKSDTEIVVREVLDEESEITVYGNGLVLYRSGKYATVFPLHSDGSCTYDNNGNPLSESQLDFLENENWYIRLYMEGDARIQKNKEKAVAKRCISYSEAAEDCSMMKDETMDLEKIVLDREQLRELLSFVDGRAAYAIEKFYGDQMDQKEIARHLNMQRPAVSKMIRKNIIKIRKATGINSTEFVSKRNKK